MVAADLAKWLAYGPCNVVQMWGYNAQGSTVYIQLHEAPPATISSIATGSVPTLPGGTVPKCKSYQVLAGQPFYFSMNNLNLNECLLMLSSTEASLTAVGAGGGLDMTIEFNSDYFVDGTEGVVGNLTAATNHSNVCPEANGPCTLLRVDAVELLGTAATIIIANSDADADVPMGRTYALPANATKTLLFGKDSPTKTFTIDPAGHVLRQGMVVRVADALAGGYAPSFPWTLSANRAYLRCYFRPQLA